MKKVQTQVPEEVHERLTELAESEGVPVASIVRRIILRSRIAARGAGRPRGTKNTVTDLGSK